MWNWPLLDSLDLVGIDGHSIPKDDMAQVAEGSTTKFTLGHLCEYLVKPEVSENLMEMKQVGILAGAIDENVIEKYKDKFSQYLPEG